MTAPTERELLPCPWCGTVPPEAEEDSDSFLWWIWCQHLDCKVQPTTGGQDTKEQAIATWNTRHLAERPGEAVDTLSPAERILVELRPAAKAWADQRARDVLKCKDGKFPAHYLEPLKDDESRSIEILSYIDTLLPAVWDEVKKEHGSFTAPAEPARGTVEAIEKALLGMHTREEYLGGQRTKYIQQGEAIDVIRALFGALSGSPVTVNAQIFKLLQEARNVIAATYPFDTQAIAVLIANIDRAMLAARNG